MQCPKCRSEDNSIIDTRKYNTVVSRVRYCCTCEYLWSTKELIDEQFTHKGFQKRASENAEPGLFFEKDEKAKKNE